MRSKPVLLAVYFVFVISVTLGAVSMFHSYAHRNDFHYPSCQDGFICPDADGIPGGAVTAPSDWTGEGAIMLLGACALITPWRWKLSAAVAIVAGVSLGWALFGAADEYGTRRAQFDEWVFGFGLLMLVAVGALKVGSVIKANEARLAFCFAAMVIVGSAVPVVVLSGYNAY